MTLSDLIVPLQPQDHLCRFCKLRKADPNNDLGLCSPCWDYHKSQGPGGRAAGAAFEVEEPEPLMAIGVGK